MIFDAEDSTLLLTPVMILSIEHPSGWYLIINYLILPIMVIVVSEVPQITGCGCYAKVA